MNLSPDKKIAGVLAPLFALRRDNDLGIGDVAALRDFIDWTVEAGFKVVQMLPINEIGGDNSPYNAISAMAIEPTTLELAPGTPVDLSADDYESVIKDFNVDKLRRGAVKYPQVKKLKRRLLEIAFRNFGRAATEGRRAAFHAFVEKESDWLDDYTFFRALMEENKGSEAWDQWRPEHQPIEKARSWSRELPAEEQRRFGDRQVFFSYVQWIARTQWREAREYAEKRGVALMGDIPFGVSYYSADVFARPSDFRLDWCGGAPPEPYFKDDEFTMKWGQNWGIPLYNWEAMRGNDFGWWRRRVRGIREVFDIFRIDHVLGFYRIYAFPWRPTRNQEFLPLEWNQMLEKTGGRAPHFAPRDDSNPQNCEANMREGEHYLRMVLQETGNTRVVGEDLGTVPDYVRPHLRSLGIAGFKIPQWEAPHGKLVAGHDYERLSVATYATHDHKPIRALWNEAMEQETSTSGQSRSDLNKIAEFAGFNPNGRPLDFEKHFYPAVMRALFQCSAWIAVLMLTDLLARKYRFNVPGTAADSNWSRRMQRTISQLRSSRTEQRRMRLMRELLEQSGRI